MNTMQTVFSNYILDVSFLAWFSAQLIKTILAYIPTKKVSWERMVGAGGMPSSHSSLVCAMAVATAKKVGYASPEFALALGFAAVVMYDAMGVRRAAGEQAKVLNKMITDFKDMFQVMKEEFDALARGEFLGNLEYRSGKKLKEFLGHTPLEVLCGAVLGISIAAFIPAF